MTSRWFFRWSWDDTIGLLVMRLAWSGAYVTITWSPDNHQQILELGQCTSLWAQLGRPLMDLLYCHLFRGFQPQLHLLLGLLCLWSIGRLLTSLWRLERVESLLLVAWITTFPFLVNVFGFETGKFSIPLAYLLTTLAWVLVSRCSGLKFWCAPLLLTASLSLYQTSLNLLVVIAMLSLAFSREPPVPSVPFRAQVVPTVVRLTLLAFPGVMLYAVTTKAARWYLRAGYNPRHAVMGGPETPLGLLHQLKDIRPLQALIVARSCAAAPRHRRLCRRGGTCGAEPPTLATAGPPGCRRRGVWTTDLPVTGPLHPRLAPRSTPIGLAVFDTAVAQSIEASPHHSPRQPLLITGALRASARPPGL